jgi:hypothetical protein
MSMRDLVRRTGINIGRFLGAAALLTCIVVAMFVLLEVGFRVKNVLAPRFASRPATPPMRDPQLLQPWFRGYFAENIASRATHWQPFVIFRRNGPYHGRYVNIDSLGRRVTPQPSSPATPSARVFFLGGSTMWGTSQRDDHTIAAEASRRLQLLAGPGRRVEVTNLGDAGYVFPQEIAMLVNELRAGNVPDVVLFYDGINDAIATVQNGVPGLTQNEVKRVKEFAMGRALDRSELQHTVRNDLHAARVLAAAGLEHLEFYNALMSLKHGAEPKYIAADSAARGTVASYRNNIPIVEALSKAYGFTAIYVWQPALQSTVKPLTPFEARLRKQLDADPFQKRLKEMHVLMPPLVDSAMKGVVPGRFINAAFLFKDDTSHVFVDRIGHNSEKSVPRIVDAFWPELQTAVTERLARPGQVIMAGAASAKAPESVKGRAGSQPQPHR